MPSGPAATVLANGGRLYVDHAHPEYASPEVASARDGALWDAAGELIMLRALQAAGAAGTPISLYKNNTDGKGASYGTHENYLVSRELPWEELVAYLTPFLVTRQVFTGSGRVGLGPKSTEAGFQLSQRADFVEAHVGLETTFNRPIVNTRDEPHADPTAWRRLHVIVGDATMLDTATYLRIGTTMAVLDLAEQGAWPPGFLDRVTLADPVAAFREVSRDLTLSRELPLAQGGCTTAIQIQREYADVARAATGAGEGAVNERWVDLLTQLSAWGAAAGADGGVAGGAGESPCEGEGACERVVEWLAKYRVLEGLRARHGLTWDDPRLAAADLRWSDVDPARSLFARVRAAGGVDTMFGEDEIAWAADHPPVNTRAFARGETVRRFGSHVAAANWSSITLASAPEEWTRIGLDSPFKHAQHDLGPEWAAASTAPEAAAALARCHSDAPDSPPADR
jgi:proteasome accessory factor A